MARRTNRPLVSVVMVVRNVDQFLAEAIESILSQTFTDFEFIILDFGSTDKSKEIASSYAARDERIKLHEVRSCELGEARNAACFLADGKYIAIQDADDISMPDRLLWEVEFMEKHPDLGLLGGAAEWVDAQAKSLWTLNLPTEDPEIRSALSNRCPFCQTAVLLRREAFVAIGGYRVAFAPSEDYDLWLRISERYRCANLKQVVVKYRIHPQQVSLSRREHQTFCAVAARASAALRKNGRPDPLDSAETITPELLASLRVPPAELQVSLFRDNRDWIANMFAAKEYSAALQLATEMLTSDWEYIEPRKIAYLRLVVAQLYWRQKRFLESFFAACRVLRPAAAKDFGKALLRRIWKFARAQHQNALVVPQSSQSFDGSRIYEHQHSHEASAMVHSSLARISVVVCTHNRCDKLKDTLVSLAQLSVPDDLPWELIVVDNNSSDGTKEVVESFVRIPRLNAKYVLERNAGLSHARNRGVAESQGEIISFLDDDVVVTSQWLTEIWKAFQQHGAMCVGGRVLLHGDPHMPSWWHQTFDVAVGKFDRGDEVILSENGDAELIGIGANISFRRIVFEKYGLFDTGMGRIGNRGHRTGEETDLVLRLRRNNELAIYYPRAVVYHCISNDRFSKRYLRLNAYHFGASRYVSESEVLSKRPTVLGVPLWMYRDILAAAGMTFFLTLLRRRAEALVQERRMLGYLGYSAAAWRSRETVTGSANSLK